MGCLISCFQDVPEENVKFTKKFIYNKNPKKSCYDDPYPDFFEPFYTKQFKRQNKGFKNKYKVL